MKNFPLICVVGPDSLRKNRPGGGARPEAGRRGGVRRLYADLSGNVHRNGEAGSGRDAWSSPPYDRFFVSQGTVQRGGLRCHGSKSNTGYSQKRKAPNTGRRHRPVCAGSHRGDPFSGGTRKPGNPARLERRAEEKGAADLFRELQAVDPPSAERIDRNNEKRVLRALEIYYLTGETMTERLSVPAPASCPSSRC